MDYLTTKQTAEIWGISDRRVRVLCREGRIPGVIEEDGVYLIPSDAEKPSDRRFRRKTYEQYTYTPDGGVLAVNEQPGRYASEKPLSYLKWADEVVGLIYGENSLRFTRPDLNEVVRLYARGRERWSAGELEEFIRGRIVSRDRRDIEKILFRYGLSAYDPLRIGFATKAVNARDLLWITDDPEESMQDAVSEVFSSIFVQKTDAEGDSIDTPEGMNIKRYGVFGGSYGIYKRRLSPVTADVESELAVSRLAEAMGIRCCRTFRADEDTVFSCFEYDFSKEYIVHMRRLVEARDAYGQVRSDNEYLNLISARPQYQADIIRMIALDFVTRQDDRHLSNMAVKISGSGESFYPLYDNGRSLFYEDSEETAARACENTELYSTSFGASGTYYDYVKEIAESGVAFSRLLDLDIDENEVLRILRDSGFKSYRLEASLKWIGDTLKILRTI